MSSGIPLSLWRLKDTRLALRVIWSVLGVMRRCSNELRNTCQHPLATSLTPAAGSEEIHILTVFFWTFLGDLFWWAVRAVLQLFKRKPALCSWQTISSGAHFPGWSALVSQIIESLSEPICVCAASFKRFSLIIQVVQTNCFNALICKAEPHRLRFQLCKGWSRKDVKPGCPCGAN